MINLDTETIHVPTYEPDKIAHWEVWFVTPKGLVETLKEAKADGNTNIVPIPVAVGTFVFEPCLTQGVLVNGT